MRRILGILGATLFFLFCIVAVLMAKDTNTLSIQSISWLLVASSWRKTFSPDSSKLSNTPIHARLSLRSARDEQPEIGDHIASAFFDHRCARSRWQ
ncbi:MAG: hypothetical protein EHM28_14105 [Spirochaetaceae bacterium]|nr:MAG: hypothetical protein EHM28_14105 [Spirochaetaceae bacterium]